MKSPYKFIKHNFFCQRDWCWHENNISLQKKNAVKLLKSIDPEKMNVNLEFFINAIDGGFEYLKKKQNAHPLKEVRTAFLENARSDCNKLNEMIEHLRISFARMQESQSSVVNGI